MRRILSACCAVGLLYACGSSDPKLVDSPMSRMLSPFGLSASRGVAEHVRLDWNIPVDSKPNAFRVERDGVEIAVVAANRTTWFDTSADPGMVETPRPPDVRSEPDRVSIAWSAPGTREGGNHSYAVIADYGGVDRRSESAVGNRGAPSITGFVVRRDGTLLATLPPGASSYDDEAVAPGTVDPPIGLAIHPSEDAVGLAWGEPKVQPGASFRYTVEALSEIGATAASDGRRAGRAPGAIVGYVIKRDGAPIASLPASARSFEDGGALPGALIPSAAFSARQEEDGIRLEWSSASARQGFEHAYEVMAVTSDSVGMPAAAGGFRSAPTVTSYRLLRDGTLAATLSATASSYLDAGAAPGTLRAPTGLTIAGSATGTTLSWSAPAGDPGATYRYELVASSDLGQATASSVVSASRGAPAVSEYLVLRDGSEIARLSPMVTTYEDRGAAPQLEPPALAATPGTDAVDLSWQPPTSSGSTFHTWQVVAGRKDGQRSAPASVSGSSGAVVTQYVVSRDGLDVATLPPGASSFHDIGAQPGTVDHPALELRSSVDRVTLRWDPPAVHQGPTHAYQVKAITSVGTAVPSLPVSAARSAPAISGYRIDRDWMPLASLPAAQRSYDDSSASAGDATAAELLVASTVGSVGLSWQSAVTTPGQSRSYELYVLAGTSAIGSPEVVGGRAGPTVTGYLLRRDGASIASLVPTAVSYDDGGAAPGSVDPMGSVTSSPGLGSIALTWQAPAVNPGPTHAYVLETQLDTGAVKASSVKSGGRAAPVLTAYRITRDGAVVATLPATATAYDDATTGAGSFSGALALTAQARIDGIRLDWTKPVPQAGSAHAYTVQALAGTMSSLASAPSSAARTAPSITGFVVTRDGVTIASLPPAAVSHDDTASAAGNADAPQGLAATAGVDSIRLDWSAAVARAGGAHTYGVAANTDLGTDLVSAPASSARLAPTVTGYRLLRDGTEIASTPATTFTDAGASPGALHEPTGVVATQGTRPDAVGLTWVAAATEPGQPHAYSVVADTDAGPTAASSAVTAACLEPAIVRYEVSRDGGSWMTAGAGTGYDDTSAPRGSVTATATAQPNDVLSFVELDLVASPAYAAGASSTYEVRAMTATGPGPVSSPATGFRGPGPVTGLTFQWQRSAADSDGGYADLPGAIDPASIDTTNPLGAGRYYRLAYDGSGVSGYSTPARALALGYSSVSAGGTHTCGVRTDGSARCWGSGADGQTTVPAGIQLLDVAAGGRHTCGLRADRKIQCWGYNSDRQASPPNLDSFRSISAGDIHTCGVRQTTFLGLDMVCWGSNASSRSNPPNLFLRSWSTLVSAGGKHTCGRDSQDHIECWGSSSDNQTREPNGVSRIVDVAAGDLHTCAVLQGTNLLSCWGSNTYGQTSRPSGTFQRVSAGSRHSCAIRTDGTIACWGSSADGRLVPPAGTYTKLSAGADHTCGIHSDGRIDCWGKNTNGQAPHQP